VAAVHGGLDDNTRPELTGGRYRAHKLAMLMQGWVEGHGDSHRVRQLVIWWRLCRARSLEAGRWICRWGV
jgi:hypothetical protein